MKHINLAGLDLNLLVTLHILLTTRQVTAAAEQMNKTQSAVSHALNRLRDLFEDPLLVRSGNEMKLTSRASELIEPLETFLHHTQMLFVPKAEIEPATLRQVFTLVTTDYSEALIMPTLIKRLSTEAPGVRLECVFTAGDAESMVQQGRIDLALIVSYRDLGGLMCQTLYEEELVCVVRDDHPTLRCDEDLTLESFVAADHVLISPRGKPGGYVDNHLETLGLKRRVVLVTYSFLSAPFIVGQTDCILTMPRGLARRLIDAKWGLRVLRAPMELPKFRLQILFHERLQFDPISRWFRELIQECCYRD